MQATAAVKQYGNILIIGLLFFVFGFTWLGSVLIPLPAYHAYHSVLFNLTVAFSFYISYTIDGYSIFLGVRKQVKKGMVPGFW